MTVEPRQLDKHAKHAGFNEVHCIAEDDSHFMGFPRSPLTEDAERGAISRQLVDVWRLYIPIPSTISNQLASTAQGLAAPLD